MKSSPYGLSSARKIRSGFNKHANAGLRPKSDWQKAEAAARQAELGAGPEMQGTAAVLRLVLSTPQRYASKLA